MVIVIAMRVDLRDESVMADEAFALSPISARALQPSEADYDAIREAFMETSRGRWFLGEYAKRNRNADTSMVLDAVARIEETLAAHRQPPAPDNRLGEALAAIRSAVDQATETAAAAFDGATLEATLAPIRKGTRIIKEISWRWREIGADGRICDLIDSQLDAIEAGCGQIAERDPRAALIAAFNEIKASVDAFADIEGEDTAPPAAEDAISDGVVLVEPIRPEQPAPEALAAGSVESAVEGSLAEGSLVEGSVAEEALVEEAFIGESIIDEAVGTPETPADEVAETIEPAELAVEAAETQTDAEVDVQAVAQAAAQADAHDKAVLELVAAEMAAPDPIDIDDFSASADDDIIVTMRPVEAVSTERMPEPVAAPVRPPIVQPFSQSSPPVSFQPSPVVTREPSPEPAIEPSLGSTIIANGILQPAKVPANDALAPIRRMSQAEKIAFFS